MPAVRLEDISDEDVEFLKQASLTWLVDPHLRRMNVTYYRGRWGAEVTLQTARVHKMFTGRAFGETRIRVLREAYEESSEKLNRYLDRLINSERERGK